MKAVLFEYGSNCNYIFQFILASKTLICGNFSENKMKEMNDYIFIRQEILNVTWKEINFFSRIFQLATSGIEFSVLGTEQDIKIGQRA
jgi:hypothetical protein